MLASLCLLVLTVLLTGTHAQPATYRKPMPGLVATRRENGTRRFPRKPSAAERGGDVVAGYTTTNNFVRHFSVHYNMLSVAGEYKHGLWRWQMEGASLPFWWCELGGIWLGDDGMADTPSTSTAPDGQGPQRNMKDIWARIDRAPMADRYGPLGKAAAIDRLAHKAVRVYMHGSGVYLWKNRNSSTRPFLTPVTESEGSFEIYILRAPYQASNYFNVQACPPGKRITDINDSFCGNQHTFVAVVPTAGISANAITFPGFGYAFGPDGTCPECNGESCKCDALVLDLFFSGYLHDQDPLTLFVPEYIMPSEETVQGYKFAETLFKNTCDSKSG